MGFPVYYHELFLRGYPRFSEQISSAAAAQTRTITPSSRPEPDFSMLPILAEDEPIPEPLIFPQEPRPGMPTLHPQAIRQPVLATLMLPRLETGMAWLRTTNMTGAAQQNAAFQNGIDPIMAGVGLLPPHAEEDD